jgi:hypothetical protein
VANTFRSLQDSVLHQIGDLSGSTRTFAKRWLNDARNEVWDQLSGNFKEAVDYFATTADYDSSSVITVTVTNGSTTVTSDGSTNTAFTADMVGRFINLNGTDPWYRIASRTSALEIELADAYIGDSDTACAFEVHTYIYPIAADCSRLISAYVEDEQNETELTILDRVDVLSRLPVPLRWTREVPDYIWIEVLSGTTVQVGIYPIPDAVTLIRYRYEKNPTEMSADADVVGIPNADACILNKALVFAFSHKGKMDRAQFYKQMAELELDRLRITVSRTARTPRFRRKDHTDAGLATGVFANLGAWYPRRSR